MFKFLSRNKAHPSKQPLKIFSPIFLTATVLGIGKIPIMPGTFGSLVAALEFTLYSHLIAKISLFWGYLLFMLPITWYVIFSYLKTSSDSDPQEIVIDEYYGQYLAQLIPTTIFFLLDKGIDNFYGIILVSFLFFRLFDIKKPWLVGYFDRNYKNAFGILFDDVVAGILAGIATIPIIKFSAWFLEIFS